MRRVVLVLLVLTPYHVSAQSADELAKQTQNPVANLISVPFQGNFDAGLGPREAIGSTLNIQPVVPFELTKSWNVILRVIMPVLSQPTDDGLRLNGLSDVVATVFLSPRKTGAVIWGAGPVFLLPTATDFALGTEKLGLGPSVVALVQPREWTLGVLFNQIWSVDGPPDRADVNRMLLQPFANYNFGDGMAGGAQIEANADWEADAWTSFLLFSLTKVTRLGTLPISFIVAAGPAIASPDGGAEWKFRVGATFLFPLKR